MNKHPFRGTGVALVTPFTITGKIDYDSLTRLVKHVTKGNVDYLVVLGTTGESAVLSKEERDSVITHILEANVNDLPVVLGMGGNNTALLVEQIKSQDFKGVSAILSVSPYYNKPTQNGIYQHYKAVAEACPLPVIIYNVPGRTGSTISPETTIRLARDYKNIIATKEASGNLEAIMKIIQKKPEGFEVISGDDALSLPLMSLGAIGVISVIANGLPREMSSLINLCLQDDYLSARKFQYKLVDIIGSIFEEGNPAGVKAVLNHQKITGKYVRLPLVEVSDVLDQKIQTLCDLILKA